jgi:hypothetical protein
LKVPRQCPLVLLVKGFFYEREREKKVGGGSERHYRFEGGVIET